MATAAVQDNVISLSRGSITYVDNPTPRLIFNSPNRTENRDLIMFGGAVKNLIHFLPKAFEVAKSITEEELKMDRENIFNEVLSCYTAQTIFLSTLTTATSASGSKGSFLEQTLNNGMLAKEDFKLPLRIWRPTLWISSPNTLTL